MKSEARPIEVLDSFSGVERTEHHPDPIDHVWRQSASFIILE
jgi:hypothetical protein